MENESYKDVLVDMELVVSSKNQAFLAEFSENIAVISLSPNIKNSIVYEYDMKSDCEPKQYNLEKYISDKPELGQCLYISKNLLNISEIKEIYSDIPCCFINTHINDVADICVKHEISGMEKIQKIKRK